MSRFALLKELPNRTSSEARRDLLREVTESLSGQGGAPSAEETAELDRIMASVASEFSTQVRAEFARLVASNAGQFSHAAERFAMDEIEVAAPVLKHSDALSEDVLLRVVAEKSAPIRPSGSVTRPIGRFERLASPVNCVVIGWLATRPIIRRAAVPLLPMSSAASGLQ